ncbi:MAG: hypothetical protein LBC73_03310 [Oscillospiraceae bacterium]|jgi:hypothetical protein|nr:hypothetical protein [Oscillospiraceae bacterium]
MKKFTIAIILLMLTLSFVAPITHVEACESYSESLFHMHRTGYNGTAHFTTYRVNGARAWAQIHVFGLYSETHHAAINGVATARVPAAITDAHEHSAGVW